MTYQLITTQNFENHLFEIEFYYRTFESDIRADKVVSSIEETIERITHKPFEFPFDAKYPTQEIRKAIVHQIFIILFSIKKSHIELHDIIHGKINI